MNSRPYESILDYRFLCQVLSHLFARSQAPAWERGLGNSAFTGKAHS